MSEGSTAKAIRGLTIAVWALVFVYVVGAVVPYLWGYMSFWMHSGEMHSNIEGHMPHPVTPRGGSSDDELEGFYDWPVEKQIAAASAIVLTKYSNDGVKLTSTVSEILKLAPGTTLYYKVGDEYRGGSRFIKDDVSYGEGEIVFFTGSPARMRMSTTYSDGRCGGLGDMPIAMLKEMIAAQGSKAAEPPDNAQQDQQP